MDFTGLIEPHPPSVQGARIKVRDASCFLDCANYSNGRLAIKAYLANHEPWGVLTVNLPDDPLEPGEFFVKHWGGNEPLVEAALACGLFIDTGKRVETGYVHAHVWRMAK